jgi:hypothetical protein
LDAKITVLFPDSIRTDYQPCTLNGAGHWWQKTFMDAYQFCAEYAHETTSGKISFTLNVVNRFINIYTYFTPEYFNKENIKRLRMIMIDYYNEGLSNTRINDLPAEKIELPKFIFE